MTEYDNIAKEYTELEKNRPERIHFIDNSFMKSLENLKNKEVLDLACGSGQFTRKIKLAGAKRVIGADISKEMIRLAKEKENKKPLGIKYFVRDVTNLGIIGKFDIITAAFLLNYSKTKEELSLMCKSVYNNLKDGQKFITITNNPSFPLIEGEKYGIIVRNNKPFLNEGDKLYVEIVLKNSRVCLENYFWSRETYEKALRNSGFREVEWIPMKISKEGLKKFGTDFWKTLIEKPYLIIIKAIK